MNKEEMKVINTKWENLSEDEKKKWNEADSMFSGKARYILCQEQLERKLKRENSWH